MVRFEIDSAVTGYSLCISNFKEIIMRVIRKTIILALAGLGLYKAWEIANEQLGEARRRTTAAKARIEPAVRQTEATVQAAADDVSASVHDLSHTIADTIATATGSPEELETSTIPSRSVP